MSPSTSSMADHTWRNTGTVVDNRLDSTGDALWSARDHRLYVAGRAPGSGLQVNALTYDSASRSWDVAAGFPVTVSTSTSESTTIDQDSLGRLWVTYTRGSKVWVAHSDAAQQGWTSGFQPSVADTTIDSDDLSSLIAFGTSVGVMYSDQQSGGFHFAIHDDADPDGAWRSEDIESMPNMADDHINLKQLVGDPQGRIFAAIKTSAETAPNASGSDPLVGVLTRTPHPDGSGTWDFAPAGTVADDHTRPLIMIDATNKELYFFATAPVQGGDIFYKKAPLSDVDFGSGAGKGKPFIDVSTVVNNASGAKDPVTAATGMVLLAVSHSRKQYVHGEMRLAGGAPSVVGQTPSASATGVAVGARVTATFSEPVQGVSATTFTLAAADGTPVPATVAPGTGNQWVLDPDQDLAEGTTYTARLDGGAGAIRDLDDNPLSPSPVSWSFSTVQPSTGDGVPPTVKSHVPTQDATSVGVSANVTATFSEAVQGVTSGTFQLADTASGEPVAAAVSRKGSTNTWILDPTANLAADRHYTVTLVGGPSAIRDLRNTPLQTTGWQFLTGPAPKVSSKSPKANANGVSLTANVTATFNEPVLNVGTPTFTLTDPGGTQQAAQVSRDGTTNKWILNPVGTLAPSTKYDVTVLGGPGGVTDLAGNPLVTVTWSFTTGG